MSCLVVHAGDANWVKTSGNWSVGTNWSGGVAPGSTSLLTSPDTATFGVAQKSGSITIDKTGQNIGSIWMLDSDSGLSTYIGSSTGNPLLLSSGGSVVEWAQGNDIITDSVNAPIVLEPASSTSGGIYTFANNDYKIASVLSFGGPISAGSTTGSVVLNLTGISSTMNTIGGAISDGGAAGGLSVVVGQNSAWTLSGSNSYSGNTTLNGGTLTLQGSMGSTGQLIVNGGTFNDTSTTPQTVNGLNVNSGLSIVTAAAGKTLNLGAITHSPGSMVAFHGLTATGSITTSNSGFLGPWAYFVASGSIDYAVGGGGSSAIAAYTGYTAATHGTLANMTNPSVNYTYNSGSTTLSSDLTGNTLNFIQGSTPTINLGGHTLTLNGIILGGASFTGTGTIAIGSNNELDLFSDGSPSPISAVISGAGKLVVGTEVLAGGYLSLLGNNTYSGGTVINAGVLDIEAPGTSSTNSALGTGPITLNNGAQLVNNSNPSKNISLATNNVQYWNGSFSYLSGSPLSLGTGNITLLSNSTISNLSPIAVVEAGTIGGTGDLNFGSSVIYGKVILNGSVNSTGQVINLGAGGVTINGNIGSNVTRFIQNGSSTVVLAGTNIYTGGTSIGFGTIQVGSGGTSGNLAIGPVTDNGALVYDRSDNLTENNLISGTGTVSQIGSGILTLAATNTFSGGITISNGTVQVGAIAAIGSAQPLGENGTLTLSGASSTAPGVLQYTGGIATLNQAVTVSSGNYGAIDNTGGGHLTLNGAITESNSELILSGGYFAVLSQITGGTTSNFNSIFTVSNGAQVTLGNSNNYTGPTNIFGGSSLTGLAQNSLPVGTVLTLGSSGDGAVTNIFDLHFNNQMLAALDGLLPATNVVTNGGANGTAVLTLTGLNSDGSAVNSSFAGQIYDGPHGAIALTVTGGTHTLNGTFAYSGATTINGGTLIINGNWSRSSSINVAKGATLNITSGTVAVSGTVTNYGTLDLGQGVQLSSTGNFINVGTLDMSNDPSFVLPPNFINVGTIIYPYDTPTMPSLGLAILAALLVTVASRCLPRTPACSKLSR